MASTLKAERNAVRARLNDLNFGNAILQADLVDAAIQDVYGLMVLQGLGARAWRDDFLDLVAGTNNYSLTFNSTEQKATILALRISHTSTTAPGQELMRLDPVSIKQLMGNETATGIPIYYALVDNAGDVTLWIYPTPDGSLNLQSLEALFDDQARQIELDTDPIYLSYSGLSALRELAAARIANKLGPKMLEKLDLPPDAWQDMKANGDRMLYGEKARLNRQWQPNAPHRPGWPVVA